MVLLFIITETGKNTMTNVLHGTADILLSSYQEVNCHVSAFSPYQWYYSVRDDFRKWKSVRSVQCVHGCRDYPCGRFFVCAAALRFTEKQKAGLDSQAQMDLSRRCNRCFYNGISKSGLHLYQHHERDRPGTSGTDSYFPGDRQFRIVWYGKRPLPGMHLSAWVYRCLVSL